MSPIDGPQVPGNHWFLQISWWTSVASSEQGSDHRQISDPRMILGRGATVCRGGSVGDGCGGAGDPYPVVVGGHVDEQSAGPAHVLALQHGDLCWGID